jgi:hypothetical protein
VLPVEEAGVEATPVEEWVPEEILIEEVVVEEVVVEEAPVEVVAEEVIAEPVVKEAAPLPEVAPAVEAATLPEVAPTVEAAALPEAATIPETAPEFEPAVPVSTGPYLEIVDSGAHIPLVEQATTLMGRVDEVSSIYPDVDLTPHGGEEGGVSRRHAELSYQGGAWFVVDLDSTNGTYLNGVEVQPKVRTPLKDGDRLALGELEIVFYA